jgi:hypothetical protein
VLGWRLQRTTGAENNGSQDNSLKIRDAQTGQETLTPGPRIFVTTEYHQEEKVHA